jgi:hypothetical protein
MFSRANAKKYDRNKPHSPRPERPEQATEPHRNFTASLPHKGGKQCRLIESWPVETILAEENRHFFRRKAATIFRLLFIDSFESTKQCHLEISLTSRKPSKVSFADGPGIE